MLEELDTSIKEVTRLMKVCLDSDAKKDLEFELNYHQVKKLFYEYSLYNEDFSIPVESLAQIYLLAGRERFAILALLIFYQVYRKPIINRNVCKMLDISINSLHKYRRVLKRLNLIPVIQKKVVVN